MNIKDTPELLRLVIVFGIGLLFGSLVSYNSGFRSGKKEGPTPIIVKLPPSAVTLQTNNLMVYIDTKSGMKFLRLKEIKN